METSTKIMCPFFSRICQPFSLTVISVIALLLTYFPSPIPSQAPSWFISNLHKWKVFVCKPVIWIWGRKSGWSGVHTWWRILGHSRNHTPQLYDISYACFQLTSSKCPPYQGFLNFDVHESPGDFVKMKRFSRFGEELMICIFNTLPSDAILL